MSKKGSREERELVNMLWEANCAAMRAPASGGATKNPLPDVVAGNGKIYLAIEVKSSSKDRIYINSEKIEALCEFSEIFGAEPFIGAKFKREKWRFVHPTNLYKTKQNNFRLDKDLAFKQGIDFEELMGKSKQIKLTENSEKI
jgi:Holliday junction resolvase